MARRQEQRQYPGVTPDDCFEAAQVAFKQSGMEVWKLRSIAWLAQARIQEGETYIGANLMARPGAQTEITLTVSGDHADQQRIDLLTEKILSEMQIALAARKSGGKKYISCS